MVWEIRDIFEIANLIMEQEITEINGNIETGGIGTSEIKEGQIITHHMTDNPTSEDDIMGRKDTRGIMTQEQRIELEICRKKQMELRRVVRKH